MALRIQFMALFEIIHMASNTKRKLTHVIVFFFLLTIVFVLGSFGLPSAWSEEKIGFLSRDETAAINGYFIFLVFLSHLRSYIDSANYIFLDKGFLIVMSFLRQLVVVTFLFYSGYGIMESIKRKGPVYVFDLPFRRLAPFLLDVLLALFVFIAARVINGNGLPSLSRMLLSIVGWNSIGNSNWYIFAILSLWIITYISFRLAPRESQRYLALSLVSILTLGYCLIMMREGVGTRFYNTVFCYPAGMLLSLTKEPIERLFSHYKMTIFPRILVLAVLFTVFLLLHYNIKSRGLKYNVQAIVFALLISYCSTFTTHISKPLVWAGKNLFFLFIYQRIPMMLFKPWLATNSPAFCLACFAAIIPFCLVMPKVHTRWKAFFLDPKVTMGRDTPS